MNYQLPETVEQYIHRVGRTARAGRAGRSVSFATEQNRKIVKQIVGQAVRPVKSRVIPPNIIEKYIGKIKDLEPEVKQIIDEETAEREIAKVSNLSRLDPKPELGYILLYTLAYTFLTLIFQGHNGF